MSPRLLLALAASLGLSGCHVFRTSDTWRSVSQVRPDAPLHSPDPSAAYADKLHRVLDARSIEHSVVTYQFRYTSNLREESVATRTAVIYKDATRPSHPWWLMDDRLGRPLWLPNGPADAQLAFYLQHPAEVIEQKTFDPKAADAKGMVASASSVETRTPSAAIVRANSPAPSPSATKQTPASPQIALGELFRSIHGSSFDPESALDQRKMSMLRRPTAAIAPTL